MPKVDKEGARRRMNFKLASQFCVPAPSLAFFSITYPSFFSTGDIGPSWFQVRRPVSQLCPGVQGVRRPEPGRILRRQRNERQTPPLQAAICLTDLEMWELRQEVRALRRRRVLRGYVCLWPLPKTKRPNLVSPVSAYSVAKARSCVSSGPQDASRAYGSLN